MQIGVMGAGTIGCYLGGRLAQAGHSVTLIGRPWLGEHLRDAGLTLTRFQRPDVHLPLGPGLSFSTDPAALGSAEVVLVTVKGRDTASAGRQLSPHLPVGGTVVSFQNGLRNAAVLREVLPSHRVVAGMVPFNVVRLPPTRFHQGTSGELFIGAAPLSAALARSLQQAGLPTLISQDMDGVLLTKLVFNLNNAINALSGLTLKAQLSDPRFRRLTAAVFREGLSVFKAAGTPVRRAGRMVPQIAPYMLRLPNWLLFRLAAPMIQIDPTARSSMWEDLEQRRPTEIGDLNGHLVALAQEVGAPAPLNAHLVGLIRQAESAGAGSPGLAPEALWPS